MSPEQEIQVTEETEEEEISIDMDELRREIINDVKVKQEEQRKNVEEKDKLEEDTVKPDMEEDISLSKLELLVLAFFNNQDIEEKNRNNKSFPNEDDAIRCITYSIFGEKIYEDTLRIVEEAFEKLWTIGLLHYNKAWIKLTSKAIEYIDKSGIETEYEKISKENKNVILSYKEWHVPLLLIKKSRKNISNPKYNELFSKLRKYGLIFINQDNAGLMEYFFEENEDMEEKFKLLESKIKEEIHTNIKIILEKQEENPLLKIFAYRLLECKNTSNRYIKGREELSKIIVDNIGLFLKTYIFSVDEAIIDVFNVGDMLEQMVKEKDVIETLYKEPDDIIKNFNLSYNEWNEFLNNFKDEMADKYSDLIVVSIDGYVYIPDFWKEKIFDLFYEENREYLELLAYLSQTKELEESHKTFCDLLISNKNICKKPLNADQFLEKYYPYYYSNVMKTNDFDDLQVGFEPSIKKFITDNLSEDDIKTYYHMQLIDELEIVEDKSTILDRFMIKNSIQKLKSLSFISYDEEYNFLTPQASSDLIHRILKDVYSYEDFKEKLKSDLVNRFSKLSEKEKTILSLIIMPESLDTGIEIKLPDTVRLFSTQLLNANVSGQRFEELKKDFYLLKTERGFQSSVKEFIMDIFDRIDLNNIPYSLFDRGKEDAEKYIDEIFKNKMPSYFYRLLKGELIEDEILELEKCGLILSDGNNNPIVHPALKDVFKDKWSEHWNDLDKIIGKNVVKQTEDQRIKEFGMKCNIETYTIFSNPYISIDHIGDDWIGIEIVNKNLKLDTLRLDSIDIEHTILVSEELELNRFNPREETGKEALLNGLTFIELKSGRIYSANKHWNEIAQTVETHIGNEIRVPNEYFSVFHDLQEKIKEKKAEELHEKAKKALSEKVKEEEKEVEKIDELWQEIFFGEDEIILFDPDQYLNGKLKTFTFLVHGLPGCGKTTQIERQAKLLKRRIEDKLNWKTPIHYLSIKKVLDYRASPVDYCHTLFSVILQELKPSREEKGRPGIIIIQDLDAIAEQKLTPTSDVKEGQKISLIIKDFLKEVFEKQEYQLAVFAEATNLNIVPEYLLQFFPNRKVVLAPSIEEREKLFDRVRVETIEKRLKKENPEIRKELIEIIGLPIKKKHTKSLSQHTQGFTYRDLSVLIRDLKQHIKGEMGNDDLIKLIRRYEPSLPQYLRIEIPKVDWSNVKGLEEQKKKIKESLLILDDGDTRKIKDDLSINPARGLLFYGVPGTGKTFLAKAIANKSNAYFIHLTPPQIFSKYFGESERNLKHVFTLAKELSSYGGSNVIIFIDELDGFAPSREKIESRPERSVLSVLLSELDGLEELKGVTIIGTTNRPWDVDSALIRSGRFDEWIEFKPPNFDICAEIFHSELNKYVRKNVPDIEVIKEKLKKIEDKTYNNQIKDNFEDLLVPADLSSFAHRISRKSFIYDDKKLLKLIDENIDSVIKEKELRKEWLTKKITNNSVSRDN